MQGLLFLEKSLKSELTPIISAPVGLLQTGASLSFSSHAELPSETICSSADFTAAFIVLLVGFRL